MMMVMVLGRELIVLAAFGAFYSVKRFAVEYVSVADMVEQLGFAGAAPIGGVAIA